MLHSDAQHHYQLAKYDQLLWKIHEVILEDTMLLPSFAVGPAAKCLIRGIWGRKSMIRRKVLVCISVILLTASSVSSDGGTMSVQVRTSQLRSTPSFLAPVIELVSYGDQVSIQQRQVGWREVKTAKGQQGWIHESALSDKRIVLNAGKGEARVDASGKEITLAGKGFNPETEKDFKSKHAGADFATVDRMEAIKLTPAQVQSFLQAGSLKTSEGNVR